MRVLAIIVVLVLSWSFVPVPGILAQDSAPTEYQIKAAFLFHFAQFVDWPSQVFAGSNAPMVIGVLGKNDFGESLEQTIRNKAVNNHPFQLKAVHSVQEAAHCEILFISSSEMKRLPDILGKLAGRPVLTVGEMDHFTEAGGIINFVIQNDEVHFQINNNAARKAGLRISSKLLTLAVR